MDPRCQLFWPLSLPAKEKERGQEILIAVGKRLTEEALSTQLIIKDRYPLEKKLEGGGEP